MRILWSLHGNLQQPTVWDVLACSLRETGKDFLVKPVNLWETLAKDCWQWSHGFCEYVRLSCQAASQQQHYLLGYSLGGRLAMHALLTDPSLWTGAIIISADPGIADPQVKEACLSRDLTWGNRFLTEPWSHLLTEWDALPVFCDRPCQTPRPEGEFDRHKIARAFDCYSKGRMDDLRSPLQALTIPITYVTGSEDQRYHQLGVELAHQIPRLQHISLNQAGHRVPWEQPEAFLNLLLTVLAR